GAGEDERERDGSVEQIRAPGLAHTLNRTKHVKHVVKQLKNKANPAAESAKHRHLLTQNANLQNTQLANTLEQPHCLVLTALQITLNHHLNIKHVSALKQLAQNESRAHCGQHAHLVGATVGRELG